MHKINCFGGLAASSKYFRRSCKNIDLEKMGWFSTQDPVAEKLPVRLGSATSPATAWLRSLKAALRGDIQHYTNGHCDDLGSNKEIIGKFLDSCEEWFAKQGSSSDKTAAVYLLMLHKLNYSYRSFSFREENRSLITNELFRRIGIVCGEEEAFQGKGLDGVLATNVSDDLRVSIDRILTEVKQLNNDPYGDRFSRLLHDSWHAPRADRRSARLEADLKGTAYRRPLGEKAEIAIGALLNHLPLLPVQLVGSLVFAIYKSRYTSEGAMGAAGVLKSSLSASGVAPEIRIVQKVKRDDPSAFENFINNLEALRLKDVSKNKDYVAKLVNLLHALKVNRQKIPADTNQKLKNYVMDQISWHLMLAKTGCSAELDHKLMATLPQAIKDVAQKPNIRNFAHKKRQLFTNAGFSDQAFSILFGDKSKKSEPCSQQELQWILQGPAGCRERPVGNGSLLELEGIEVVYKDVLNVLRKSFCGEVTDVVRYWPLRIKWGNNVLLKRFLLNSEFQDIYRDMLGKDLDEDNPGVEVDKKVRPVEVAEAFVFGAVLAWLAPMLMATVFAPKELALAAVTGMPGESAGGLRTAARFV